MTHYVTWYDNGSRYFECGGEYDVATPLEAAKLERKEVVHDATVVVTASWDDDPNIDPAVILATIPAGTPNK